MDCKNLKVTTQSGFTCTFYGEESGILKVLSFDGRALHVNVVIESSVGELEEGKPLKFRYIAGMSSETFESASPIVSIEKL